MNKVGLVAVGDYLGDCNTTTRIPYLILAFVVLLQEFGPGLHQAQLRDFPSLLTGWCLSFRHRFITKLILSRGSTDDGHHSCERRFFSSMVGETLPHFPSGWRWDKRGNPQLTQLRESNSPGYDWPA